MWGCATVPVASPREVTTAGAPKPSPHARAKVLEAARALVGSTRIVVNGKRYGDDCTGLVRAAYAQAQVNLMTQGLSGDNGVTAIFRFASAHGQVYRGGWPVPGDLVFFKDTYDVNRDGRIDDGLTHIGIVDDIDATGTVTVIHRVARGVVRYRMNLALRELAVGPKGSTVNDYLRSASKGDKPRLTSELFSAYATVLPVESGVVGSR